MVWRFEIRQENESSKHAAPTSIDCGKRSDGLKAWRPQGIEEIEGRKHDLRHEKVARHDSQYHGAQDVLGAIKRNL